MALKPWELDALTPGEFHELLDGYTWRAKKQNWDLALLLTAITRKVVKPDDLMPKEEKKAEAPKKREEVLADLRALDAELNEGLRKKRAQAAANGSAGRP